MDSSLHSSVIIVGAGVSGILAAKVLVENGVDVVILEASDQIGGRIRREEFGGLKVELGAGWICGIDGENLNPIWEMAGKLGIRTLYSDYSNARYRIYDRSGKIFPSRLAADSYKKAVDLAIEKLRREKKEGEEIAAASEPFLTPKTPMELAIDFTLHDFEMAEAVPLPTFTEFGAKEYLIADERGYGYLLYKIAEEFLSTSEGKIVDTRLHLNKVVREIQHSRDGVRLTTEDGSIYEADYVISSVSIGVLKSDLISFSPPLPRWKMDAIENLDILVYTKIFLKFPKKFWPSEPGSEYFLYAHERRGYYTFWQHLENAFPGCNILVVTLTNEESKRVEAQPDQDTLKEAMAVLRDMFGPDIPNATDILVPRWWSNRLQRGSYSNYPIVSDHSLVRDIKAPVGRIFFTGEHTSKKYSGYVHGAYLAGIDSGLSLLEEMKKEKGLKRDASSSSSQVKRIEALTGSLSLSENDVVGPTGLHQSSNSGNLKSKL